MLSPIFFPMHYYIPIDDREDKNMSDKSRY